VRGEGGKSVALLWDESFLWGVMAYKALAAGGCSFDLVCSDDVRSGALKKYALLFVPGGWASNKLKALGDGGREEIKRFVFDGGAYLGICGGAGLATADGLGLLPVKRRPTKERVPSFSGRINLAVTPHRIWRGIAEPVFHAWWPSQFVVDGEGPVVLAVYGEAMPDAFSSDVNVGDAAAAGIWPELEGIYGINLDPKRLYGEPAVIEGRYGAGKALLSLVHFDTPGDPNGALVLKNLLARLAPDAASGGAPEAGGCSPARDGSAGPRFHEMESAIEELISMGMRNFLWFWRNSLLLQWRRGVRGLEYCTLRVLVREIGAHLRRDHGNREIAGVDETLERVRNALLPFADKAKRLLMRERLALQDSHITYERCEDPEIRALREELFSRSKSHGGLFKEVVDEMDRLLYTLLARR
jgi:Biotin-protein ligase, N terminal